MANFIFNVGRGSIGERIRRVRANDPAGCALVVVALATAGVATDAALKDLDTLSAILAGSSNEPGNIGYARKLLVAADLPAPTVDDAADKLYGDMPDLQWPAVAAGDSWSKLLVCWRPAAGSPDTDVVPLSGHDFAVTPNGGNVNAVVASSGFYESA